MDDIRDVIVIGASAGGVDAVAHLLAQLPGDLQAAVFVAVHTHAGSPGHLAAILDRSSPLKVRIANDRATIYHGNVYVAPPDRHLIVETETMRVIRGPKENRSRPSIDPLFRSAALSYGSRVVGILLTGYLDDGVSGLKSISDAGGVTLVQDPDDALIPDMPSAALARLTIDHCLPVHRMGAVLTQLVGRPQEEADARPSERTLIEVAIATGKDISMETQESLGKAADLGCPECGGPLREIHDDAVRRYRCHIGHAYTTSALLADQGEQVERALGAALRTLEEKARLLTELADQVGDDPVNGWQARAEEARTHAETLRQLVLNGGSIERNAEAELTPSD